MFLNPTNFICSSQNGSKASAINCIIATITLVMAKQKNI